MPHRSGGALQGGVNVTGWAAGTGCRCGAGAGLSVLHLLRSTAQMVLIGWHHVHVACRDWHSAGWWHNKHTPSLRSEPWYTKSNPTNSSAGRRVSPPPDPHETRPAGPD